MTALELRILTGARAGRSSTFQQSLITVGRGPTCDLRFDPAIDLDVSALQAEIHANRSGYAIIDLGSTNGTFVNGARLAQGSPRPLRDGDVVAFGGTAGPSVAVHLQAPRMRTTQRIAVAVREQTRGLRIAAAGLIVVLGGLAAGGVWAGRRAIAARDAQIGQLVAGDESTSKQLSVALARIGDTSLVMALLRRNDSLVAAARTASSASASAAARQALHANQSLQKALGTMDLPAIHDANDSAIVLIASQLGPLAYESTGFGVRSSGLIVTNRHVVRDSSGSAARLAVKYANTTAWRAAHLVRVADDSTVDLALVQVDDPGPFPTIAHLAGSAAVPVGAPIATLGFPFGTAAPMDTSGADLVPRTTLTIGTVSKLVRGLVQIDAFAAHGSSGSPVFDARGDVIGVIWGGEPGSGGRVVFAVPSDQITRILRSVR